MWSVGDTATAASAAMKVLIISVLRNSILWIFENKFVDFYYNFCIYLLLVKTRFFEHFENLSFHYYLFVSRHSVI